MVNDSDVNYKDNIYHYCTTGKKVMYRVQFTTLYLTENINNNNYKKVMYRVQFTILYLTENINNNNYKVKSVMFI
jgi:hypothetical protein